MRFLFTSFSKNSIIHCAGVRIVSLFFLFIFPTILLGQESKGDKLMEDLQYIKAIKVYQNALKNDTANDQLLYKLAQSYKKIKDYPKSVIYFNKITNFSSLPSEAHLFYGQSLMSINDLTQAKAEFRQYSEKNPKSLVARLAVQSLDDIKEWKSVKRPFRVDSVSGINTSFSEFSPVSFQNNLVFTSDRQIDYNNDRSFGWTGNPYLSIYKSLKQPSNPTNFTEVELFSNQLTTDYHDGPISFDEEGVEAFYTRVNKVNKFKRFTNQMKVYTAIFNGKKWIDEEELVINSDDYSVGQPYFCKERNRLYFSSDMPGGFGGMDLYYIIKANEGWSKPINLGRYINTAANEVFPSCHEDKLYFSSDGLSGYGGLDLFQSQITSIDHTRPINLKAPINSNLDDFGLSFFTENSGYFSSNRTGGKGGDDIYYFQMMDSSYADTAQISGVFEYNGLPVEGIKLNLKDENGTIIEVVYTDAKGNFQFNALPSDKSYIVTLDEDDTSNYDSANIFITNDKGEKVLLADRLADGSFKFNALPLDLINQMELIEEDDGSLNSMIVVAQVYKKLPGDYSKISKVYLFDKKGVLIDSMLTDTSGMISFRKLAVDKDYLMALEDPEPNTFFALYNLNNRIVSLPQKDINRRVFVDKQALINYYSLGNRKVEHTAFVGKAELNKVAQANIKLYLYNLSGDTLSTTFTNKKGEFEFNQLKVDENYLIRISDENPEDYQKTKLYEATNEGRKIEQLVRLRDGNFTFVARPFYKLNDLKNRILVEDLVTLNGLVYRKLPGDFTDSIEVLILDDSGNIVGRTYTDRDGRFKFTKLDPDQQYSFVVAESDDEDLSLLLENDLNIFLTNTIRTGKGKFEYTKLTAEVSVLEEIAEVDEGLVFKKGEYAIFGQVYKKLPNDYNKPVLVYLLDEQGNIVDVLLSDQFGRFKFESLNADQNYSFKVGDESGDLNMVLYNINDDVIASAAKLGRGNFKYTKLDIDQAIIKLENIEDSKVFYAFQESPSSLRDIPLDASYPDFLNQFVIYYDFDSFTIDLSETGKLDDLAERLIKQPTINLEVISYADPMGPKRYNDKLSKKRTKSVLEYFENKGINKNRLKGIGKGEVNLLLIQDILNVPLTKEENRINRRTEFKIYTK